MKMNEFDNIPNELTTYTVADAAKLLNVSKDFIYEQLRAGKLPHVKMGKCRIRHQALVNFLADMETTQYWERTVPLNV